MEKNCQNSITKVTVLRGGPDREHHISMQSGEAIVKCLKKIQNIQTVDYPFKNPEDINYKRLQGTIVFPALHGSWGEGGYLQEKLENFKIKFIGSKSKSAKLAINKHLTKKIASQLKIQTPEWCLITNQESCPFEPPIILKPQTEGSSFGIELVENKDDWSSTLKRALTFSNSVIAERFIKGREFSVGFLIDKILNPIEIIADQKIYSYKAKYNSTKTTYIDTPEIDSKIIKKMSKMTNNLLENIHARDVARVDFLVNNEGPWFLEINSMPGFTRKSLLPKMALRDGLSFETLCHNLIKTAKNRSS